MSGNGQERASSVGGRAYFNALGHRSCNFAHEISNSTTYTFAPWVLFRFAEVDGTF